MGGFNIGIGVGLRYPAPKLGNANVNPPEPDITDALLMEDGSLFLMEDGSYFILEDSAVLQTFSVNQVNDTNTTAKTRKTRSTTSKNTATSKKVDKNYWHFTNNK